MDKAKSIDEYIDSVPKSIRNKLRELHRIIKDVVPEATEKISYGMPYFNYKGRLSYFRLASSYIGLYIPPPIVAQHQKELRGYKTSVSTIQLPLNKKLPIPLIRKLLKARAKINEQTRK